MLSKYNTYYTCYSFLEKLSDVDKMTMSVTITILCILGSTFLLIMPDNTTASDKFFQTGGRFGKRHDEHIPGTNSWFIYKCDIK